MKKIMYGIFLLFVLFLFGCSKIVDKPSMVSIDSLRTATCDELHSNFQNCRLENQINNWDYCADLFIPFYIEKCV